MDIKFYNNNYQIFSERFPFVPYLIRYGFNVAWICLYDNQPFDEADFAPSLITGQMQEKVQ